MNGRRTRRVSDPDSGSALILALLFVFAIGMVLTVLLSLTDTNLLNTGNVRAQRNVEFAADTAIDGAIQTARHQPATSPCPSFPSSRPGLTTDGVAIKVDCLESTFAGPTRRFVEFDACAAANASAFSACQTSAIIRAEVVYDDLPADCPPGSAPPGCLMTISNWVVRSANG